MKLLAPIAIAAVLSTATSVVLAQTCSTALPDPKAQPRDDAGKFGLIAQQCAGVFAEPVKVREAAQLGLYDRGASVTIRMSDPPAADEPPAPPPAAVVRKPAPNVPLGRDGLRVLSVAPALNAAARIYELDPLLLHAIAHVESRHNANAVSPAGARGVMQMMPATGRRFGVDNPERSLMNADVNVQASAAYLRTLRTRFGGDLALVLAAYNAGEGAVDKYRGIPPYRETQAYVRDVMAVYERLRSEFEVSADGTLLARGPQVGSGR